MSLDNSEVLDSSKENIQPLRHGRKAAQLKTALQAQIDPEVNQQLMKQREKYEYMIRMYEGEDPLDPYYSYILWLEQSFPCIGRENNMFLLLEDTLLKFKDCEKYRQDRRLVQLLIKYINFQSNTLELYQLVYNQGLGTMCSSFYKAWAEELEKANDFKRADQVFQLGLQCRAEPVKELEDAHIQFQLSIARKLLEGNLNPTAISSTDDQSRAVLSKLSSSKVKSNRVSKDSAGIFSSIQKTVNVKNSNFGHGKFQVFQEDDDDNDLNKRFKSDKEMLPKGSTANRENLMSASKWYGQKVKQTYARMSTVSSGPTFDIHEDPEAACDNIKTVFRPYALRARKEEFKCPVAIFGPPNPNQLPMYPKQLVYVGGRDVQLEEIRAAFYWKKVKKQETDGTVNESPLIFESSPAVEAEISQSIHSSNLSAEFPENEQKSERLISHRAKPVDAIDVIDDDDRNFRKCSRYTKIFESSGCDMLITPAKPVTSVEVYMDDDNSSAVSNKCRPHERSQNDSLLPTLLKENVNIDSKIAIENELYTSGNKEFEFAKPAPPAGKMKSIGSIDIFIDNENLQRSCYSPKRFENFDSVRISGRTDGQYVKKTEGIQNSLCSEQENVSFNHNLSASMTINTKAAMNVIQQMWESPLTQSDALESLNTDSAVKSSKCLFPIYCEDDDPPTDRNEPVKRSKISFPIFCDDTFSVQSKQHSERANVTASKPSVHSKRSEKTMVSKVQKKNYQTDRKFGTALPLIVPVKLQDSPVRPDNKENKFLAEYLTDEDGERCEQVTDTEDEFQLDDETCNTKVFAVTLPSSTPCLRAERSRTSRKSVYDASYFSQDNDFSVCYAKPTTSSLISLENHWRYNKTASDLSLILENSKEHGSSSSSSNSGNAGSKLSFS